MQRRDWEQMKSDPVSEKSEIGAKREQAHHHDASHCEGQKHPRAGCVADPFKSTYRLLRPLINLDQGDAVLAGILLLRRLDRHCRRCSCPRLRRLGMLSRLWRSRASECRNARQDGSSFRDSERPSDGSLIGHRVPHGRDRHDDSWSKIPSERNSGGGKQRHVISIHGGNENACRQIATSGHRRT
jgi:hypothetical protein